MMPSSVERANTIRKMGRRLRGNSVATYGAASLFPRIVAIFGAIALTPIALHFLGPRQFAFWVLATQVPSLIISPDLGLSQGIVTELSQARHDIPRQIPRLIGLRRILRLVALGWFLLGTVCAVAYWTSTSESSDRTELAVSITIAVACFTMGIPATIWTRVQLAQERGHVAVLWEGAGKTAAIGSSLVALVIFPNLYVLIASFLLPPTLALWANQVRFLHRHRQVDHARPARLTLSQAWKANRRTFTAGKFFVLMQVAYLISVALDPYLVGMLAGTDGVTFVSITRRPFDVLPVIVSLFSVALWPVFIRWRSEGRHRELRTLVTNLSIAAAAVMTAGGTAIVLFRHPIYEILGQGYVAPTIADLASVTGLIAGVSAVSILGMYLNSVSAERTLAYILLAGAFFAIAAKVSALHWLDVHAFLQVGTLSYLLFTAAPVLFAVVLHMRRSTDRN